jgi:hypothetical protein
VKKADQAGQAGKPCRYTTEEEHLVAFMENGRKSEWAQVPELLFKRKETCRKEN